MNMSYNAIVDSDCGERTCYEIPSCERSVCKSFDLSVPVTVTPYARPEKPEVECMGGVEIISGIRDHQCHEHFEFTIKQRIKVNIPIRYGARVCIDRPCAEDKGDCYHQPEL
jgi:hypothetical protein